MKLAQLALVPMLVLALFAGTGMAAQTPTDTPGQAGEAGPPNDLPGPVPDFVEDLLGSIQQFIDGALEGDLGDAVSGIAGDSSESGG